MSALNRPEAKMEASDRLSIPYLDRLFADAALDCKFDRGMAVANLVLRWLARERTNPFSYLAFLTDLAEKCMLNEEEKKTWH